MFIFDTFIKKLQTSQKGNNSTRWLLKVIFKQPFDIKRAGCSHQITMCIALVFKMVVE